MVRYIAMREATDLLVNIHKEMENHHLAKMTHGTKWGFSIAMSMLSDLRGTQQPIHMFWLVSALPCTDEIAIWRIDVDIVNGQVMCSR